MKITINQQKSEKLFKDLPIPCIFIFDPSDADDEMFCVKISKSSYLFFCEEEGSGIFNFDKTNNYANSTVIPMDIDQITISKKE